MAAAAALVALGLLALPARAHETMGHFDHSGGQTNLYGRRIGAPPLPDGKLTNCCLHKNARGEESGDCRSFPDENVAEVVRDGVPGYLLKALAGDDDQDDEFIPESQASVSPDQRFYRCRHGRSYDDYDGGHHAPSAVVPKSHCFFVPKKWS